MATYQYNDTFDGGYIRYNLSPASGYIGPGMTVTVSGVVKDSSAAYRSILLGFYKNQALTGRVEAVKALAVKKNVEKSFSISVMMTYEMWDYYHPASGYTNGSLSPVVLFTVNQKTAAAVGRSVLDDDCFGDNISSWAQQITGTWPWSIYREAATAPTIPSSPVWTDEASVSALTILGNMVTVHSLPRVSGSWAYDSRYPDQLGHVALALTGAMTGTYEVDVGSGVTAAAFDLPAPTQAGTVNWTYTVTDMFGNSAVASGSFTVLSYAKPEINAWMPERYHVVITPTGPATEEADDGERVWVTILANIAAVNSRNAWQATLTAWRAGEPEIDPVAGEARAEDATGAVATIASWSLSGSDGQSVELRRNEGQLNDLTLSASLSWRMRLTITDALGNSATVVSDDIEKAGAMFDVEPGGVAVGQRVTSQESAPRFQCALPAELMDDVAVKADGLLKVVRIAPFTSVNIAAKAVKSGTYTITTSDVGAGWTAVGVVGYSMGQSTFNVYRLRLAVDSTDTIEYSVGNLDTSAHTGSLGCMVLCVRTGL